MGAPAIYHMPNRRKSACSLVSNNINGLDRRTTNYEKYLKVFSGEFERLSRIHQFGFKSWGEIFMFVVQLPNTEPLFIGINGNIVNWTGQGHVHKGRTQSRK